MIPPPSLVSLEPRGEGDLGIRVRGPSRAAYGASLHVAHGSELEVEREMRELTGSGVRREIMINEPCGLR